MIEVGLVQEVIAVEMVEVYSEAQEHSPWNESELQSELDCMFEFVLLDRMILVHDEHWDKDHGIDSEVNPESEDDIRNILFDVVGLSLYQSFFNSFLRSDIPMGFVSKVEIPERSCQNHCDALATAPDADVDQERIKICKHADDYSCFSVVV